MRPIHWRLAWSLAAAGLLAGCGAGANASPPTWVPQPSVTLEAGPHVSLPNQPGPRPGPSGSSAPGSTPQPGNPSGAPDPRALATGLNAPTGLALLPDGSALVGERTTGRIVRVQPQPGKPVPTVRTLTGLATSGDGGLLDLALSPTYADDGLIYAYVTTPTDNRVIDFTLTGKTAPVLTGIPRGKTGNTGRLMFDARGLLYVGTGDAGHPALAAKPSSLAGKVLRIDAIGSDYGWPSGGTASTRPVQTLPASRSGAGGCAVMGGRLFVATSDGKAVLTTPSSGRAPSGKFTVAFGGRYGRLLTVVAAPDGALWLTTTNKDGHGSPVPDDERVLRVVPTTSGGGGSPL